MSATPPTESNVTDITKKKRTVKPKQEELPGVEMVRNEFIEAKAEQYAEARDSRMAFGKSERGFKLELLTLMHEHKIQDYERADIQIHIKSEEKIKVTIKGKVVDDGTGDSDEE